MPTTASLHGAAPGSREELGPDSAPGEEARLEGTYPGALPSRKPGLGAHWSQRARMQSGAPKLLPITQTTLVSDHANKNYTASN